MVSTLRDPLRTRSEPSGWLSAALLRPQELLRAIGARDTRMVVLLAGVYGGLLLPAFFGAAHASKFLMVLTHLIFWAALGIFLGLVWVQAVAFPAAMLSNLFGGRGEVQAARNSVALSLLPVALLLFGYWLVRLAGQPEFARLTFLSGWPAASLWSLRNLRLCLMESYRLRRPAAGASASIAGVFGIWISLAIGLLPLALTLRIMAIGGS